MVFYGQAVGSHFVATRRSPLESVVVKTNEEEEEQGGRSLFLRGWLTEAETAEVLLQILWIFKNYFHFHFVIQHHQLRFPDSGVSTL